MPDWLHALDVWLYQAGVQVWHLYWPIFVAVLVFSLLERIFPLERGQPWGIVRFNLVWQLLSVVILYCLSASAWGSFIAWLTALVPVPILRLTPSDSAFGEVGRVLLVIAIGDLAAYWTHRLMHAVPALWSIHRMHHDEEQLHAATGIRQHWLNAPFTQVVVAPPVAWLLGAQTIPDHIGILTGLMSLFQHANLRLALGWFTPVLAGPQWHRIHHARAPALYNRNFSAIFPVWDLLFGTYRHPARNEFVATGLEGVPASDGYWRTFFQPFADWWVLARGAMQRGRRQQGQ